MTGLSKILFSGLLIFLFGSFSTLQAETTRHYLVKDGKSSSGIILAENAIPAEKTAAREFKKYIQQISGAELEIVSPKQSSQFKQKILIGWSDKVKQLLPPTDLSSMESDRIIIKTIGDNLILTGGRPRGTLYAVYTFLEDFLGVRWWTSKAEFVPEQKTIRISAINVDYTPSLSDFRMTLYQDVNRNPSFAAKLKSQGYYQNFPLEWGGNIKVDPYPSHTYFRLLPPEKYFAEHPEWYSADKDGKRFHERGQLCETNQEMAKEMVKVINEFRSKPGSSRYVAIKPMDWQGACQCAQCQALVKSEGSPSALIVHLANYVAREIIKKYPDTEITISAYDYYQNPPKTLKCEKNIIIQFTTSKFSMFHPADSSKNQERFKYFKQWKAQNPNSRFWIWDYNATFSDFLQPLPNYSITPTNIKTFAANGARGMMVQGAYKCPVGDFVAMRAWIVGHLLWNPSLDYDKLEDEFLKGYYGKAAPYLKRYLKLMVDNAEAKGVELNLSLKSMDFLTPEVLVKGTELFRRALEVVKDNPEQYRHVEEAEVPLVYAVISFLCRDRKAKISDFPALGFQHPEQAVDWMEKILKRYKYPFVKEGKNNSLGPFINLLKNALKYNTNKNEYQEVHAQIYYGAKVIDDSEASNGKAVKIDGNTNRWLLQYYLPKTFSPNKKSTLNAVVRCNFAKDLPPDTPIFYFGYCGCEGVMKRIVLRREIPDDGKYHVYSLKLNSRNKPSKSKMKYFWIGPQGKKLKGKIESVICDRMYITNPADNYVLGGNLLPNKGFAGCLPGSTLPIKGWRLNYNMKAKGGFIKDESFKENGPVLKLVNPVADKAVVVKGIPFEIKEPGKYDGSVYIKPEKDALALPKKKNPAVIMRTIKTDWKKGFYDNTQKIQKGWTKYEYEFSVPKNLLGKYFFRIDIAGSGTFYIAKPSLNPIRKKSAK